MTWVWTWRGTSFGYLLNDALFTYFGREAGRLYGEEIYGADGRYLGEIRNSNRLITRRSKHNRRKSRFTPRRGGRYVRYAGYVGYVMYTGYEDFPDPDTFS